MKRKQKLKQPRPFSLVEYEAYAGEKRSSFKKGSQQIFLGEILNMPGHCVVSDVKTGKIIVGFHMERFREIPEDQT